MFRTFNMGIGFMLIVERDSADRIARALKNLGEEVWVVGEIKRGERRIVL